MTTILHLLLLTFFILIGGTSIAQYSADVSFYQVKDGLPNKKVSCIIQDDMGYIWVGTKAGLSRFDGHEFKVYSIRNGLSGTRIYDMCKGEEGQIWVATNKGVLAYRRGRFEPLILDTLRTDLTTFSLATDYKGALWLGTLNGVYCYDADSIRHYDFKAFPQIEKNYVFSIVTSRDSALWFGGEAMLMRYKNHHWSQIDLPDRQEKVEGGLSRNRLWSLVPYGNTQVVASYLEHTLLIGVDSCQELILSEEQKKEAVFGRILPASQKGHLIETLNVPFADSPMYVIHPFCEDRDGNLWIGSYDGLKKITPSAFRSYPFMENTGTDVFTTAKGEVIVGQDSLLLFLPDGFVIENEKRWNEAAIKNVRSTLIDDDVLYIGTHYDGLFILEQDEIQYFQIDKDIHKNNAFALSKDSLNRLWVGTFGKGLSIYEDMDTSPLVLTDQNGLSSNLIYSLLNDASGRMWIGTENGLEYFENGKINKIESHPVLAYTAVYCMVQDPLNRIWFGTESGLYCFEKEVGFRLVLSSDNGLKSPFIKSLLLDDSGQLWIGTTNGIYQINTRGGGEKELLLKSIHESGDFNSINCELHSACKDAKGNLYWGLSDGILMYNPLKDTIDSKAPLLSFEGVKLFDSLLEMPHTNSVLDLRFDYEENHLTFNFIGISHRQADKVTYSYKLEGFDPEWSPFLSTSAATYSNLPPGDYQFQVMAQNADRVRNESPLSMAVVIAPPFWETTWFRLMVLSCFAFMVYGVFKFQVFIYNKELVNELIAILIKKIKKPETLYIKVIDGSFVNIELNDILFLRASRNYVDILTVDEKYIIYASLSKTLKNLPGKKIIRIHRSYAVNISRIDKICRTSVGIDQHEIPIGRSFKDNLKKVIPRLVRLNKTT